MSSQYHCPHCGKCDQQIFSRRQLRQGLGSRTNRRTRVKSGDRTRPAVKLAKKVREARKEHEETCRD